MGRFVNPGNSAFQVALNSKIYVDKTGMLEYTTVRALILKKCFQDWKSAGNRILRRILISMI